jgi:hypothetical protein
MWQAWPVAVIDPAGFIADLKVHVGEHGFHVHDERHLVETYSLQQSLQVDLHPDGACGGPLDVRLALDVDPRVLLQFEDLVNSLPIDQDPSELEDFEGMDAEKYVFPLTFTWDMPPLPNGPDLLILATELAGVGGRELPLEVSAIDSFPSATDAPERSLNVVARITVPLMHLFMKEDDLCDVLDRCHAVSTHLLDHAPAWLGDDF